MNDDTFTFRRTARNWPTLVAVLAVWGALILAYLVFEASGWIVGILGLFTLPAVYDLGRNPTAGVTLNSDRLDWYSGRVHAGLDLSEIDHIRLDTRLDFSVRATAVLHSGRKIRLPFESTPPHRPFEEVLNANGVKTVRHHFSLMQ